MSLRPRAACALVLCCCSCPALLFAGDSVVPLPTDISNYHLRGTQPFTLIDFIPSPDECGACHGGSPDNKIDWDGSLMAQAARDPLFYAALEIADHDAPGIGDTCIRCHAPQGWLEGQAVPTDGSALDANAREGVSCAICHRLVDPFNWPGAPPVDPPILSSLGPMDTPVNALDLLGIPGNNGNGSYVVDPFTRLRGPFPVGTMPPGQNPPPLVSCTPFHNSFYLQPTYEASLHRRSDLCATCHDVSTPHFIYNSTTQAFDWAGTGVIEPDGNKYRMMPQQRTYSEWARSAFKNPGVDMAGRFGGIGTTVVDDCMDCHMPRANGFMCTLVPGAMRSDLGRHLFSGAATWVLDAVTKLYGPFPGFEEMSPEEVTAVGEAIPRNEKMLKCAADLEVTIEPGTLPDGPQVRVRVINQTGHKLPTGFPEGRRMWINVEFYNECAGGGIPVQVFGAYDAQTNTLDANSTKVYEAKIGPNADIAAVTGLPAGPSFHVAMSNHTYKDNRIPPRGFSNAAFEAINAQPVGATYADGQYWDDTFFAIPPGATGVRVRLFYEAASREFIEFLRDNNPNQALPGDRGEVLYDVWNNNGNRPQPLLMASYPPTSNDDGMAPCTLPFVDIQAIDPDMDGIFALARPGDINGDLVFSEADTIALAEALIAGSTDPALLCIADFSGDGELDGEDIQGYVDLVSLP